MLGLINGLFSESVLVGTFSWAYIVVCYCFSRKDGRLNKDSKRKVDAVTNDFRREISVLYFSITVAEGLALSFTDQSLGVLKASKVDEGLPVTVSGFIGLSRGCRRFICYSPITIFVVLIGHCRVVTFKNVRES